ncbi:MAG TPA: BTAD domain-containing putative transcriptional regulator [Gaiellaceae bacterium]|nr:BTAD domain-containing putative transcriptional regulator [Gaiellaceae bacterium]
MEFLILGPLEVRDGDRLIPLAGGRQRALLTLLLLNANETVSTDRIVEELWGERSPQTASKVIQNHVSQLRRVLGDESLATDGSGYRLRVERGSLDVDRFEGLLDGARTALDRADAESAAGLLRESLALWRGSPLADVAFEPFARTEIARLEERRLVAVEERIEADLMLGRHDDLVGELEALMDGNPLRERLHAQLMLALYRAGRQSEALAAYQQARSTLVEELGIEPGRPLRDLHQRILNQDPSLDLAPGAESPGEASRGAFVGRGAELSELLDGLEEALAGHGRVFLLVGEPGIGKSRLADVLTRRARVRGAAVLTGRCWEAGGAPAYWPWVQALRTYVREADRELLRSQLGAGASYVGQIVPELREELSDLAEPISLESEADRFRLFDAVAEFLRNAALRRPLLLVLDDLHAADLPSLLLLQFVVRELGSMRLLIVGAYRDVDPIPTRALTAVLAELAREPVTRRLSLMGLSRQEVGEYVELTASEIVSSTLVDALHEETGGNPLFVGETVRLLQTESAADGEATIVIPESVREVISRRIERLSDECSRTLVVASVLGREFPVDALKQVARVSEPDLLEILDEAMTARVVSGAPGSPGALRFGHVVIRDTLYEGLTAVRRIQLHRQALESLEGLYGPDPGPHLAELAFHAGAAGEPEKALRYAQSAGDRALAGLAYEEAARLYGAALDALESVSSDAETTRCRLLLSRGQAEARGGDAAVAKQTFLEAGAIARRSGLPHELAQAAAGYGVGHMWGRAGSDAQLVPLLEEGLQVVSDEDVEVRARLLARLAGALRDEHSRDRRDTLSREAVELARRTGSPTALAYALDGRTGAIIAPDTIDECLRLSSELTVVAERLDDREQLSQGHDCRGIAYSVLGDMDRARAEFDAAVAVAKDLGQPSQLWQTQSSVAAVRLAGGDLEGGEVLSSVAFELGRLAQPEMATPVYELQRFTLAEYRGTLEQVEPALQELAAAYEHRPVLRAVLAYATARLERGAEAQRAVDELARDRFSTVPFDQEWLLAMSLIAETVALVGDDVHGPVLYEVVQPWAHLNAANPGEGIRGSMSRYLGLLAATAGRWSVAEAHFEAALEMNARMRLLPWLAYTQCDYARMLVVRGAPGDAERASELLASAQTLSDEVGLKALAERIQARRTGSSPW